MTNPQTPNKPQSPNPDRPYDIRQRTFLFALRVLEITAALPEQKEAQIVREQLAKSGTSVGANVEEADGAESKADTKKSYVIARKESREARYWLRIVDRRWPAVGVQSDIAEATEIRSILSAIVRGLS